MFLCKYCIFTIDWTLRISYVHTGQYYYYYYDYSHYDYYYYDYYCLAYDITVFILYVVFV